MWRWDTQVGDTGDTEGTGGDAVRRDKRQDVHRYPKLPNAERENECSKIAAVTDKQKITTPRTHIVKVRP
ncbi:hypothetical protein VTO73DRAFT_7768 [Trametes versicolor]